jgi:selenocysteine lyase/cysteine desulfurase
MAIDVAAVRADTPGCDTVVHFNNAGAALRPSVVTDAVIEHLELESRIGGYEAAAQAADRVERAYAAVGELIGCAPGEVALVENATRAWDMAFYSFAFRPGDRILTGRAEYASNVIAMLQVAARTGAVVEVVADDEDGQVDVSDLARRIDDDRAGPVRLVAITHVPSHGGLVNPVAEIGAVTRAAGVPFLVDACQSIGQLRVDVREIGCDALASTGRKFLRGPRGTGFLYVSNAIVERLEPPFLDLHAATWVSPDRYVVRPDARRFETWEYDVAARIGLGVATDYALAVGVDDIEQRVLALGALLRTRLAELPGVAVHDLGRRRSGIVTFTVEGVDATEVHAALAARGINTSVSPVEYAQLDLPARGLPGLVRASVHYYNTEEEVDRVVHEVGSIPRR